MWKNKIQTPTVLIKCCKTDQYLSNLLVNPPFLLEETCSRIELVKRMKGRYSWENVEVVSAHFPGSLC